MQLSNLIIWVTIHFSLSSAQKECGGKPADVIFVLDSSASIGKDDFRKQIMFTKDVVDIFDIDQDRTRVGVVLFSSEVYPMFGLADFSGKLAVEKAIEEIPYKVGGTRTGKALEHIREEFRNNSRLKVPKIAIILTDGQSYDRAKTIQEANLAHAEGITIFVIGIGAGVDETELSALASGSEYLLKIGDYSALEMIKRKLAVKTCQVKYVEPTPPPSVVADQQIDASDCTLSLIVGVDTNGVSNRNVKNVLAFLSEITDSLTSRPGKLKTSQLMTECTESSRRERSKSYAPLIKKMRYQITRNSRFVKSTGLLFINSEISDIEQSRNEVRRAVFAGFRLVLVRIGRVTSDEAIARMLGAKIGSSTFSESVFDVRAYSKLPSLTSVAVDALSKAGTCI